MFKCIYDNITNCIIYSLNAPEVCDFLYQIRLPLESSYVKLSKACFMAIILGAETIFKLYMIICEVKDNSENYTRNGWLVVQVMRMLKTAKPNGSYQMTQNHTNQGIPWGVDGKNLSRPEAQGPPPHLHPKHSHKVQWASCFPSTKATRDHFVSYKFHAYCSTFISTGLLIHAWTKWSWELQIKKEEKAGND